MFRGWQKTACRNGDSRTVSGFWTKSLTAGCDQRGARVVAESRRCHFSGMADASLGTLLMTRQLKAGGLTFDEAKAIAQAATNVDPAEVETVLAFKRVRALRGVTNSGASL